MFPKIVGFLPQIINYLVGFSIIFTIHFGGPTPILGFPPKNGWPNLSSPKIAKIAKARLKKHHHHEANVLRGGNTLKEHPASALTLLFKKAKICAKARLEPKETSRFKKAENRQDMIDF